jgi:hypothetical protein
VKYSIQPGHRVDGAGGVVAQAGQRASARTLDWSGQEELLECKKDRREQIRRKEGGGEKAEKAERERKTSEGKISENLKRSGARAGGAGRGRRWLPLPRISFDSSATGAAGLVDDDGGRLRSASYKPDVSCPSNVV